MLTGATYFLEEINKQTKLMQFGVSPANSFYYENGGKHVQFGGKHAQFGVEATGSESNTGGSVHSPFVSEPDFDVFLKDMQNLETETCGNMVDGDN